MQVISNEDILHEMSNSIFLEKCDQFVVCWISPQSCKG